MDGFISLISQPSVCSFLQFVILLPVAAGLLLFVVPDRFLKIKGVFALIISLIAGYCAVVLYGSAIQMAVPDKIAGSSCFTLFGLDGGATSFLTLTVDGLSKLITLFIGIFTVIILLYSIVYIKPGRVSNYYTWVLITTGCSYGAVLADNLLLFLFFWGILGITLYKLIPGNNEDSSATAKKTLILIGASDTIMIAGIAILWKITGSLNISAITHSTTDAISITAFLALITASFTKAGAFPFHGWVPDYTRDAPASSSALIPASLDKLLGIYFLARITLDMFVLTDTVKIILLSLGVITIISAVMMALVQHNYKRLLGYHAVSQVGYMIVGFGLGSVIGIAAGLFHMVNNALYKSGLMLSAGSVEYRTGKDNLEDLGGLSRVMPVTFASSLIFAMAISGIPPLNGFASKWMIYQGIIEFGAGTGIPNKLWVVWLGLAVLGSALTLASFIKLIGGVFLGRRRKSFDKIREVPVIMWIPNLILALLCVVTGVLATNVILPRLFMPVSGEFAPVGFWDSSFVSLLVLISIALGVIIYLVTTTGKLRTEDSFIGGEKIQEEALYQTPEFYKTLLEFRLFAWLYKKAEEKWFDIYDLSKRFILWISHQLSSAHNGVLTGYVIWVFVGLVIMLLIMI